MKFIRSTTNLLRFIAIVQLLTFGLCLVPESVFADLYAWTGLGHWPHLPFLNYVIRGASYCQGAIGLLLWVVATDVIRYRPLVITTGVIYLLGAPAFYLIHASARTPHWWALMDTISCFLFGAVLLMLCFVSSPDVSPTPTVT
jgi:hypothetical protein